MSVSGGTANSPGAQVRAGTAPANPHDSAVSRRYQKVALDVLLNANELLARQKQFAALCTARAAGETLEAAWKVCPLIQLPELRAVRDYIQKHFRDVHDATREAFGPPVDGKDWLTAFVRRAFQAHYITLMFGSIVSTADASAAAVSGQQSEETGADGKDRDSARGPAAASAGNAAHTGWMVRLATYK